MADKTPRLDLVKDAVAALMGDPARSLSDLAVDTSDMATVLNRMGTFVTPDTVFGSEDWPALVRDALRESYGKYVTMAASIAEIERVLTIGDDIGGDDKGNLAFIANTLRYVKWYTGDLQQNIYGINSNTGGTLELLTSALPALTTAVTAIGTAVTALGTKLDALLECCQSQNPVNQNPAPTGGICGPWTRQTSWAYAGVFATGGGDLDAYTPIFATDPATPDPITGLLNEDNTRQIWTTDGGEGRGICLGWNVTGHDEPTAVYGRSNTASDAANLWRDLVSGLWQNEDATFPEGTVSEYAENLTGPPPAIGDIIVEYLVLYPLGSPAPTDLDFFISTRVIPS